MTTAKLYEITVRNNPSLLTRIVRVLRGATTRGGDDTAQRAGTGRRMIHSDEV